MYYFTADEHYCHKNIIKFCNRPFISVEEMNNTLIHNFNSIVTDNDITIHAGDFSLGNKKKTNEIINKLNGKHIFLWGSHDRWMKNGSYNQIHEVYYKRTPIIICHYCMRTWAKSHYNSWHLYGHSHGKLPDIGKSMDIGVDTNNFFPYSIIDISFKMHHKPNNPNLIINP